MNLKCGIEKLFQSEPIKVNAMPKNSRLLFNGKNVRPIIITEAPIRLIAKGPYPFTFIFLKIKNKCKAKKDMSTGKSHGMYGILESPKLPNILIYAAQQTGHLGKKAITKPSNELEITLMGFCLLVIGFTSLNGSAF